LDMPKLTARITLATRRVFDWISGDSNIPYCRQYPCVAYQALEPADFAKAEAENPPPQDCARLGSVE